jgi:arylsulfatase A-like enzyme
MLYRHAYANGDMTLPLTPMLTGRYPTGGAYPQGTQFLAITGEVPTLPELLRKNGYRTYGSGNPLSSIPATDSRVDSTLHHAASIGRCIL